MGHSQPCEVYLLDTDTCSHHFRGSQSVTERAANHAEGLHLSTVTLAELLTWTLRTNTAPKWHRLLLRFLDAAQVLHVTPEVAERGGQIRAEMYDQGHAVSIIDMFIADVSDRSGAARGRSCRCRQAV